jgi:hypothetical protein
MAFSDMKRHSNKGFERLSEELTKISKKGSDSYKDDRFWRPELDKSSNGYAVIRFLPPVDGEDVPWARTFSHGFQGPGGWYIEKSRTTLGEKDPVSEMNTRLWNSGNESDKDIARARKRRLSYISNIYIVSDPANPQNEGKIFLFKYGKKIHDKIVGSMQPEFEDEVAINPFDFWKGADFKLKVRKVAGYINYDKSEFSDPAPLLNDDDVMEELWKQEYPLKEHTDPSTFKSYDELKTRLDVVLGNDSVSTTKTTATTAEKVEVKSNDDDVFDTGDSESSSGDDALSYFEKLAAED